ncbi:MAG: Flp family type IVb pilin [Alphaproteobacteria bacterium]|nr:Flp family type IVb pilin [Alphaproteobacteria bacterium]
MWSSLLNLIGNIWADETGTVVIEYAMLAMTIAMAIVGVLHVMADKLGDMLMNTANKFAGQ